MAQTSEDIYTLAKRFFEQDYHDRGMVKWQGYYLSDHTEDVAKTTTKEKARAAEILKEQQSPEEIGHVLKQAYDAQLDISIQLASRDLEGLNGETIVGKIQGYMEDDEIIIQARANQNNANKQLQDC